MFIVKIEVLYPFVLLYPVHDKERAMSACAANVIESLSLLVVVIVEIEVL